MKARESGMPDEEQWESFFHPEEVLDLLELRDCRGDIVEFGCGYGTFTLAAAPRCRGLIHALDIDPEMITRVMQKARKACVSNIVVATRDFLVEGTGLGDASCEYAMLFNILHLAERETLLREAYRVLRPRGRLGVIHWNYDPATPRGPSMAIRPRPDDCQRWVQNIGFELPKSPIVMLPPYHYGFVAQKTAEAEASS
ncbi:class I SAM-dependent methyltransferase [bacterium]|nr:class I SAM-dependent methyltransferase [bacterium]